MRHHANKSFDSMCYSLLCPCPKWPDSYTVYDKLIAIKSISIKLFWLQYMVVWLMNRVNVGFLDTLILTLAIIELLWYVRCNKVMFIYWLHWLLQCIVNLRKLFSAHKSHVRETSLFTGAIPNQARNSQTSRCISFRCQVKILEGHPDETALVDGCNRWWRLTGGGVESG